MQLNPLNAGSKIQKVLTKEFMYMPGMPRMYRFDGKFGRIIDTVTKNVLSESEFTFILIGYRFFEGNLFGGTPKNWAEVFFLNEENHLCAISFHGQSADNFMKALSNSFYLGIKNPQYATIKFTIQEKSGVDSESKKIQYFIFETEVSVTNSEIILAVTSMVDSALAEHNGVVYREETLAGTLKQKTSIAYHTHLIDVKMNTVSTVIKETPQISKESTENT